MIIMTLTGILLCCLTLSTRILFGTAAFLPLKTNPTSSETCESSIAKAVAPAMEAIKDVVPNVVHGTLTLDITYKDNAILDGQSVSKAQAASAPDVAFRGDAAKHYALLMVDPDAPSPDSPSMREWLHWMVVNIPAGDVSKGKTIVGYAGPTPPRGIHRYIFLLYEQPTGVLLHPQAPAQRGKFDAVAWAKQQHLGDPVAALHFKTSAGS